jgi:hypothetical protein
MSQQEEIIKRELDKNPNISITDLERMTGLPIGEVCKLRYLWRREKKRGKRNKALVKSLEKSKINYGSADYTHNCSVLGRSQN